MSVEICIDTMVTYGSVTIVMLLSLERESSSGIEVTECRVSDGDGVRSTDVGRFESDGVIGWPAVGVTIICGVESAGVWTTHIS
jgi:hypothetical protein